MKRILISYFSCTGNTKAVAEKLAKISGGDLYEIIPEQPYTNADLNWMDSNSRTSIEMKQNKSFRPQIRGKIENIKMYDVIYIGFPIWWYVAPTIINTFLESYDFSDKIIIPFATSGSSGMGNTIEELKPSCSSSVQWKEGKRFQNSVSDSELKDWINNLNI